MDKHDIAVALWALIRVVKEDKRVVSFTEGDAFFGAHRMFGKDPVPSGYAATWSYNGFGGDMIVDPDATIDEIAERVEYS